MEWKAHRLLKREEVLNELYGLARRIEQQPITEAVEVVRCKNCQAWDNKATTPAKRCAIHGHATKPMDFCSYGERRQIDAAGTD